MTHHDIPVPGSTEEFHRLAPLLSSARADIEQTALVGICHMLSDAMRRYPGVSHGLFSFDMGLRSFLFHEKAIIPYNIHAKIEDIGDQIHNFMAKFASDQFYALCQRDAKLSGPSATEFALQMGRRDVAALIERTAICAQSQQGMPAQPTRL
jgi:hypothetical protein